MRFDVFQRKARKAFASIPEHYREGIALSRIAGLSQEELAERMQRSIPSVRNLLHRALARLAAQLDDLSGSHAEDFPS